MTHRLLQVQLDEQHAHDGGDPRDAQEIKGQVQGGRHVAVAMEAAREALLSGGRERLDELGRRKALEVRGKVRDRALADVTRRASLDLSPLGMRA